MNTLQQYFGLQLSILKRQLTDFGLHPIFGFILILVGFYGFSFYLFTESEYASYFYVFFALCLAFRYSETNRNDFLKFNFPNKTYLKIRFLENLITVIPFIIFLCFKQEFYLVLILVLFSMALTLINTKKLTAVSLPTPFYKKPFEFIVGFRNSVSIFVLAYFLTVVAIIYSNFNVGLFALMLVFLVCLSFYTETESEFYVWVHKLKAKPFLLQKIKIAILFSTMISLSITLALLFFFHTDIYVILGVQVLGYCYLVAAILAKYAIYPQKMSLPQAMLLGLGIAMPLVLIVLIPFLYFKSSTQLKEILE